MTQESDSTDGNIEARLLIPRVEITGRGAFILTGPSSCGKGELAKALCAVLSIPEERWISMGSILRQTYTRACTEPEFADTLCARYQIGSDTRILDCVDTSEEIVEKVKSHREGIKQFLSLRRGREAGNNAWQSTTQLEWLEYCTTRGLLVPNRWTQALFEAHIELLQGTADGPVIIDGYPRTKAAAIHLLDVFEDNKIPVLKVLHLSIGKQEMLQRAGKRQRLDDDIGALLKRYEFYVESVQPSVDYLKERLGSEKIALIDAHQPHYDYLDGVRTFDLNRSINNVVRSALVNIGLSGLLSDALIAPRQ